MIVARQYRIRGRVQGVGFRYFTHGVALREGLSGWVRNAPGGEVEAFVEGDLEAVERFERSISRGPTGARVEDVQITDVPPTGRTGGFFVRG